MEKFFYTKEDLAEMFGITKGSVCNYVKKGYLPKPIKVGSMWIWSKAKFEEDLFSLPDTELTEEAE